MEATFQRAIKSKPINQVGATASPQKKKELPKTPQATRPCGPTTHEGDCPAKGQKCLACGKMNQYVKVCRSTPATEGPKRNTTNQVKTESVMTEDDDMDEDVPKGTIHIVHVVDPDPRQLQTAFHCQVMVEGQPINILPLNRHQAMKSHPALHPTTTRMYAYGTTMFLPLAGVFTTTIRHQDQPTKTKVYVIKGGADMLLSCHTAEQLQLVQIAFGVYISALDFLFALQLF
ncbi:hypothetical protein NDU88_001436 [Pleurodeles waltl]|uniref:Uncharacterized protein n=1 Tax=Pleurodeles waltl TaxID=8319 RepID=A0AAV7WLY9_PLEWA|nr:hypothetical protein NDU88_001436 [Pleurodeles waltl]